MNLPKNITKENLLKAINKIDLEGIPKQADSLYYDVFYNGKVYPPKLIVAFANLFANGEILDRTKFKGGIESECFKILESNGFIIKEKIKPGFYKELIKFIDIANTQDIGKGITLSSTEFKQEASKKFEGLNIDISFGIGRATAIPWISFLADGQTTSNGIFPVYLYYLKENILILAYGVSVTNIPFKNWKLKTPYTIKKYFEDQKFGTPQNYGTSFVFKTYNLNEKLKENEINSDLKAIIDIYKNTISNKEINAIKMSHKPFDCSFFNESLAISGLFFSKEIVTRFIASLCTKPFVILTGLSGSGKTKLAQAFVMWICENEKQYCIVPVGADWSNREPLLGFPNALLEKDYRKDEFGVLKLIIEANNNSDKPYFLILDEMNLSHVERYFADFLSVMESKGKMLLHSGNMDWNNIPPEIRFPKNLFIIGTVNIDETTYMFSPKVLDRANVIEFRVSKEEMERYLLNSAFINLDNLEGFGSSMAGGFVEIAKDLSLESSEKKELISFLTDFFTQLAEIRSEFGYRSASEILRFAAVVKKIDVSWNITDIIDAAIMQKLLPKVHGSRRKLEPVLKKLAELCFIGLQTFDDLLLAKTKIDFMDTSKIKYPISLEKILRMYDNLISNGFTSYAEA